MDGEQINNADMESAQELTNFVKNVLGQMNERFTSMTENIVNRIDEMNDRLTDLEQTVSQLIDESNALENSNLPKEKTISSNMMNDKFTKTKDSNA